MDPQVQPVANSIPPPPPGFVPMPMDSSIPPPPAGFVPVGQSTPAPEAPENPQDPRAGFGIGVGEGAMQTVNSVSKLINKIPVVGETLAPSQGIAASDAISEPKTTAEKAGNFAENVAEFMGGESVAKAGLSAAAHYQQIAKVLKVLEESPKLAKALEIGMGFMRTTGVGGVQALAHGATPEEAATTGVVSGAVGAGADTLAQGIEGGVNLMKRATAAPVAAAAAPAVEEAAQATAHAPSITSGSRTVAGESIPTVDEVSAPRQEATSDQLAQMKDATKENLTKKYVTETEPAAKKVVGKQISDVVGKPVADAGEASTFYKKEAQPFFQFMQEQSKAEQDAAREEIAAAREAGHKVSDEVPDTFEELQKKTRAARSAKQFDKVDEYHDAMEEMADKYEAGGSDELKASREAWKKHIAFERIDDAFSRPGVVSDTPDELVTNKNAPDPGYWNGKPLLRQIRTLYENGTFQKAGLPPETVANWQELGRILEKQGNTQRFNAVFRSLAKEAAPVAEKVPKPPVDSGAEMAKSVANILTRRAAAGVVGGAVGGAFGGKAGAAAGTVAGVAGDYMAPAVMRKIASNPLALRALVTGLKSSASAAVVANTIRPMIQKDKEKPDEQ